MTVKLRVDSLLNEFYKNFGYDMAVKYFKVKELTNNVLSPDFNELSRVINNSKNLKVSKITPVTVNNYSHGLRPKSLVFFDEFIRRCCMDNSDGFIERNLDDSCLSFYMGQGFVETNGDLFEKIYELTNNDSYSFGLAPHVYVFTPEPQSLLNDIRTNYCLPIDSMSVTKKSLKLTNKIIVRALYAYHKQLH